METFRNFLLKLVRTIHLLLYSCVKFVWLKQIMFRFKKIILNEGNISNLSNIEGSEKCTECWKYWKQYNFAKKTPKNIAILLCLLIFEWRTYCTYHLFPFVYPSICPFTPTPASLKFLKIRYNY